jgi:hypothetical protein
MTTLENTKTLEWEELLPYLMLMYNTHVHKSTQDNSPFFLTFMHDPRMPFFDMDKPRVAYGADFVSETFRMMQHVHMAVKVNLEEAQEGSKRYYDKTAKERTFLPGDKVMVYFPNAPPRINPNFSHTGSHIQWFRWWGKLTHRLGTTKQENPQLFIWTE